MTLTTVTHVSVDGVMQGLGGPDEDRRDGFSRGGWALPLFDGETEEFLAGLYGRADAFLFGRRTYEILAAHWARRRGSGPIAAALNDRPKYVASATLTHGSWAPTTVLSGDVAGAVRELKAASPGQIQVHGSGVLVRELMGRQLVDEMVLLTYPVIVGQGTRLFPQDGADAALELLHTRTTSGGVVIAAYRPVGSPAYAPGPPDAAS